MLFVLGYLCIVLFMCWWLCGVSFLVILFFFKQKTAYEMRISDWSSDVCSSDLMAPIRRLLDREDHRGMDAARARHIFPRPLLLYGDVTAFPPRFDGGVDRKSVV